MNSLLKRNELSYANRAIEKRSNELCWYVLHYDTKTTAYLNEIEFQTYDDAMKKFKKEKPLTPADRVELIFAPFQNDSEFEENMVIYYKIKLPSPPKGATNCEKLDFYNHLIEEGLDVEELKIVRKRIYKIDTYFDIDAAMKKAMILQCLKDIISESV